MLFRFSPHTAALLLCCAALPLSAQDRWSNPATWGGSVPSAGAAVEIPAGKTILLDTSPPPLKSVTVKGTLLFEDRDLEFKAGWIMVHGRLQAGTEQQPYRRRAVITFTGNDPSENVMKMGTKGLMVMGGVLELHGEARGPSWTRLAQTAFAGATSLTLEEAVGWRAGDRLVIASTDYDPHQAEEVSVTSVSGKVVSLAAALRYTHWGEKQYYANVEVDERAEVGLLTRNITLRGDDSSAASKFGGHIMVMSGGQARVTGVELTLMGQQAILGRYPMHYHLLGDTTNLFFKNSSIHHCFNRFYTIHGTNGVFAQGIVAY